MNQIVAEKRWLEAFAQGSLLNRYSPFDSMYFRSPVATVLAKGPFVNLLDDHAEATLSTSVKRSLNFANQLGLGSSVVMGAIGFDAQRLHQLRLCGRATIRDGHGTDEQLSVQPESSVQRERPSTMAKQFSSLPEPDEFIAQVTQAQERIKISNLDKVVLSRALDVHFDDAADIPTLLRRLQTKNPNGYTFAVPVDFVGATAQRRVLIGASPELLISRRGNRVRAFPLAGSEPRNADPAADRLIAEALFTSRKDRYEHDLVIQSIEKCLRRFCRWLHVPKEPSLTSTETMWHLGTPIEGELISEETNSLDLAMALHPTPAVGGHPSQLAKSTIAEIESYPREFYAGMVGWCDAKGDGEWAVTIRCAQVQGKSVRLYAGAGIVKQSDPHKELAETSAKFRTMLKALELEL